MTIEERDRAKIKWEASVAVGSKATEEKQDWLWNKYQKADIAYQLTEGVKQLKRIADAFDRPFQSSEFKVEVQDDSQPRH